jgi:MFS family permease
VVIDLSPLRKYKDFRLLYFGQLVSMLGTNISYVAGPYLIYELTHSTAQVGLMGVVSLVPLVLFGFWGGAVADVWNRKKIIIVCEIFLTLLCAGFAWALTRGQVSVFLVFAITAVTSCFGGFHRPALESLTPRLVPKEDLPRISTLTGFRGTFAHILGPAIGGLLIAHGGVALALWADALSYLISILCLLGIRNPLREQQPGHRPGLQAIREGFAYALQRPVLLGTYLVDMIAMTFCFPSAMFPAIADASGGAGKLGPLYSAISVGALIATLLSAWTYRVRRHGVMVAAGAAGWSVCVILFAALLSVNFWLALFFLAAAGYFDMISATFRFTIWNETVPDSHRGRLAGIEMISYMSGPLLGNTWLGYLAAVTGVQTALVMGASLSLVLLALVLFLALAPFWLYTAEPREISKTSA